MDKKAFEALYVAADAIRELSGIKRVSVDNDNKGGEIFFKLANGEEYKLSLSEA